MAVGNDDRVEAPSHPGFNVIGHVSGNLGLGVVARQIVGLLQARGDAVAVFDVDDGEGRSGVDHGFGAVQVDALERLPHAINLFVVALGSLEWLLPRCPVSFFDGAKLNVAVCFWELPVLPRSWNAALDTMDVVVGASDFITETFRLCLSAAVTIPARLPIVLPVPVAFDRARIAVPDDAVLFVFGFEPRSDIARKNPHGTIEAFVRGVGTDPHAWLVIRVNNAFRKDGQLHGSVRQLEETCRAHPRIRLLTEPMSYPQVLGLYAAADVYVSLHRSEGLGLGMAEAMVMGRAVIATGWSGNMTFMDQTTAALVGYRLVPVGGGIEAYLDPEVRRRARWAEPDLADAAALMKWLVDDRPHRVALGARAAGALQAFNRVAGEGRFLDELAAIHRRRRAIGSPIAPRRWSPKPDGRWPGLLRGPVGRISAGLKWRAEKLLRAFGTKR